MKNLHLIPTDKPSSLYYKDDNYKLANSTMAIDWYISSAGYKPTNIYITSDEEIKDGDYGLSKLNEIIKFHIGYDYRYYAKIILTTDQDLIKDGVQAIDDEFLEWFVKNPSCEEVEVQKWFDGLDFLEYKIIIPQEEPKQETLEEAAERYLQEWRLLNNIHLSNQIHAERCKNDFIAGAKWQQERMYSEEDMKNAFDSAREFNSLDGVVDVHIVLPMGGDMSDLQPLHFTFEEWFEQFKKK
jgi:hypothetical protein